jgi:hypothetical protein
MRIHVTSVAVETQLCVPVVWLLILHVAVSSTKPMNDAMEKQDSVPFARLSSYEISNSCCCEQQKRTYFGLYMKGLKMLSDFNQIWSFSTNFCQRPQYQSSRNSVQWEPRCGQKDGRAEITKLIGAFRYTCERAYNGDHSYGSGLQYVRQQMQG